MSGIVCGNPQVLENVMALDDTTQLNESLPVVFVSFLDLACDMGNDESALSCLWSIVCLMLRSLHLPFVVVKLKGSKVNADCAAGNDENSETD
jgi:hypothetical protein